MALGKWKASGGMAALAAALAMLTAPVSASAQDGGWRGRGGGGGEARAERGNNGGQGWRGGERSDGNRGGQRGNGGERTAEVQNAPAPQVQAQPRTDRNWSRADRSGWEGRAAREASQTAAPTPAAPQRNYERNRAAGNGEWQGRNRSYVDPNRNGTSRDTAVRAAQQRNDRNRDRDNANRWRGNDNDNNRWRGDDSRRGSNSWSNNNRQSYGRDSRNWNRNWRQDNRYDWNRYRTSNRNAYRLGSYYAPYRDYSYRRLGIGYSLDSLFFGSRYWISDPWQYRLPPADDGYRWVRYYDDVMLVDTYSGEVVDVIYDFFW